MEIAGGGKFFFLVFVGFIVSKEYLVKILDVWGFFKG